jgi:hypothetical protein
MMQTKLRIQGVAYLSGLSAVAAAPVAVALAPEHMQPTPPAPIQCIPPASDIPTSEAEMQKVEATVQQPSTVPVPTRPDPEPNLTAQTVPAADVEMQDEEEHTFQPHGYPKRDGQPSIRWFQCQQARLNAIAASLTDHSAT